MILDLHWIQREQMTTYFIHDSRFKLDTREHMTTYFINDSRFTLHIKRTNDHILYT
jgi:hypothetical protein